MSRSDVVGSFLQPSLRNGLEAASNHVVLFALQNRGRNLESERTFGGLQSNAMQVWILNAVLMRCLVLPALGVLVSNVLRVISALSTYLTNFSHADTSPPHCESERSLYRTVAPFRNLRALSTLHLDFGAATVIVSKQMFGKIFHQQLGEIRL